MIFCSTWATFLRVVVTASLLTDMLSMPALTRNSAKSGRLDGPSPQMLTVTPFSWAILIRCAMMRLTAGVAFVEVSHLPEAFTVSVDHEYSLGHVV